jgi:F-type H+-transporting ATPase subunit delta
MSEVNSFGLSIIANRYATAFIGLAETHNLLDKLDFDLVLVKETLKENAELKDFLEHPLIQANDKKEVIDSIFQKHVSFYTLNLIKLLIDKNRIFVLSRIADHYRELLNKKRNISTAQIITAVEIDEYTRNRIREKLENMFNQTINIETLTDKEIIAGMIVRVGDKIIDGSIKTKLENMKKQLIH